MSPAKKNPKPDAKPTKDVIYIDADDEITAVIDKVETAKAKVVALVLPKRTPVLQSIVNMRLLKRASQEAARSVVLITSESALMPLAGAAGIHVAKNLQSAPEIPLAPQPDQPAAQEGKTIPAAAAEADDPGDDEKAEKIDYRRPVGELAAAAEEAEAIDLDDEDEAAASDDGDKPDAAEKPKKTKSPKVPDFDRFRLRLILAGLGVIVLAVFLVLATSVLPKATVTIATASSPISTNLSLTATTDTKNLDLKKGVIPAQLEKSDLTSSQQVTATGQKNNGQKASGTVTITTSDCSGKAPTITSGTGLSSNGLAYIVQDGTTLSPRLDSSFNCYYAGDVDATAQQGGSNYNLPSNSTFTVPGYSGLSGTNSDAFSGGTDSIVTVLSQSDINSVKDKISSDDKDKFTKDFENKLSTSNNYVLTSTMKAGDPVVSSSAKVGDQVDSATVTVKITYSVLVINRDDLKKAITDQLNTQINKSRQKIGSDDVVKDATVSVQNQTSPNAADLQITEDTTAIPLLDENEIKNQIRGLKTGGIRSTIEQWPGVKKVDVKLSPFWVSKAPKKTGKITIVLTQIKAAQADSGD